MLKILNFASLQGIGVPGSLVQLRVEEFSIGPEDVLVLDAQHFKPKAVMKMPALLIKVRVTVKG